MRIMHTLAGVDHGPFGLHQDAGHLVNRQRIRGRAHAWGWSIYQRFSDLFGKEIERDLDHDRSRSPVSHLGKGASHRVWHRLSSNDLFDRLCDMLEIEECIEIRWDVDQRPWVASRQHHDGNRVAVRLGDPAKGVLCAWSELHRTHTDALTRGDTAHSIGHMQARSFLSHDDGPNVSLCCGFNNRIDWVADEEGDSLTLENLSDGGGYVHIPPWNASCVSEEHVVICIASPRIIQMLLQYHDATSTHVAIT